MKYAKHEQQEMHRHQENKVSNTNFTQIDLL